MSEPIDETRRKLLKIGVLSSLLAAISPIVGADELSDLVYGHDGNNIIAVRLWPSSVYTRLTIESSSQINANFLINDNSSITLTLNKIQSNSILNTLPTKVIKSDPIIQSIRLKELNNGNTQILITLKQSIKIKTSNILPVNLGSVNYQYRYVFDMFPMANNLSEVSNSSGDDLIALLQLNSYVDSKEVTKSPDLALNKEVVKPFYINSQGKKNKTIIMLDPGHGGEDPGAVGLTGTQEKNVVLSIAKILYDMINQTETLQAELTRSQDIFIPLGSRVAIARKAHADLFMSIHADAFTNRQAHGSSVFMLSSGGASSSFARWLAKTQNNSDLIGGLSFKVKDNSVNRVLLDMIQGKTLEQSASLGKIILSNMARINGLHSGYVEKASFAVLKAPDIPSILVETAFISNPHEEDLLKQSSFHESVARALFNGIGKFTHQS